MVNSLHHWAHFFFLRSTVILKLDRTVNQGSLRHLSKHYDDNLIYHTYICDLIDI